MKTSSRARMLSKGASWGQKYNLFTGILSDEDERMINDQKRHIFCPLKNEAYIFGLLFLKDV